MQTHDPLAQFIVDTTDTQSDKETQSYVCTCGWGTLSRLDFQQHLQTGHLTGCGARDVNICVSDSIGLEERLR